MISILILVLLLLVATFVAAALIIFFISILISNSNGVPYASIKKQNIKSLLSWGGLSSNDIFYDLGCGDGRVLISAVKDFKIKSAVGYEITPWAYLEAKFAVWFYGLNGRAKIVRGIFLKLICLRAVLCTPIFFMSRLTSWLIS